MTPSDHRAEKAEPTGEKVPFLSRLVATGLFSGYIPWASGTFGSLVGLALYLLPGASSLPVLEPAILLGFFLGVFTSAQVARAEGNRLTKSAAAAKATFQPGVHAVADPSIVVIDEIVGMWISLIWLPKSPLAIVIAFVAFRAFDILKPEPARYLERIPDGWGIMLDDVVAGVYANLATQVVLFGLAQFVAVPFS